MLIINQTNRNAHALVRAASSHHTSRNIFDIILTCITTIIINKICVKTTNCSIRWKILHKVDDVAFKETLLKQRGQRNET